MVSLVLNLINKVYDMEVGNHEILRMENSNILNGISTLTTESLYICLFSGKTVVVHDNRPLYL